MLDDRYLVFAVAEHVMAIRCSEVREVLPRPLLFRPAGTPPVVAGSFLRGDQIVAALHLDRLLGLRQGVPGLYAPILVLRVAGPLIGLLVDRVVAFTKLEPSAGVGPPWPGARADAVQFAWDGGQGAVLRPSDLVDETARLIVADLQAAASDRLRSWQPQEAP